MNFIYGLILALGIGIASEVTGSGADYQLYCRPKDFVIPTSWQDMTYNVTTGCTGKMVEQVQNELNAAMTYLAMGANFARDSINRPGFSELFFKSASEEREHAMKIIEYLLMRGELGKDVRQLIKFPLGPPPSKSWETGADALKDALELEASVTVNIKSIIAECETNNNQNNNNYHLVDYLTGVFLEEQYTGQREIAGRLSTLSKMSETYGNLGEFMYDKKLLYGEL